MYNYTIDCLVSFTLHAISAHQRNNSDVPPPPEKEVALPDDVVRFMMIAPAAVSMNRQVNAPMRPHAKGLVFCRWRRCRSLNGCIMTLCLVCTSCLVCSMPSGELLCHLTKAHSRVGTPRLHIA